MSLGKSWWEKLISSILVILITTYIVGSILFFIDMKTISNDYKENNKNYKTEIKIINKSIDDIKQNSDDRATAMNYRFDKLNDSNAIQHKQLHNEIVRFEYVMLKGNQKLLHELKDLRELQNNNLLLSVKNNKYIQLFIDADKEFELSQK